MRPVQQGRTCTLSRLCLQWVIFSVLLASRAFGWSSQGHRLTVSIAWRYMSVSAKAHVKALLQVPLPFPRLTSLPPHLPSPETLAKRLHTPQEASRWADVVRMYSKDLWPQKESFMRLHYTSVPAFPRRVYPPTFWVESLKKPPETGQLLEGLQRSIETLRDTKRTPEEQALALRLLLHLVGDVHQPMHVLEPRFTTKKGLILGTRGANLITLPRHTQRLMWRVWHKRLKLARNLHALWDRGASLVTSRTPPQALIQAFQHSPRLQRRAHQRNVLQWAAESACLAFRALSTSDTHIKYKVHASTGRVHMLLPDHSVKKYALMMQRVVREQLYLGGVHLAGLFNAIYGPNPLQKKQLVSLPQDC